MEENIKTEITAKEKIVAVSNAKANKSMYIVLAIVAAISVFIIATSVINNNKNRKLAEQQNQPTPTDIVSDEQLVAETPYPTASVTPEPKYTNTFEDKTFFWATEKSGNIQGLYYTSPMYRQSESVTSEPTRGVFASTDPAHSTTTTVFENLTNIIKLGSLPSNLSYDTTIIVPGFEKNSYVFSVYDDINCVYKDNTDQCYQYYYKIVFNTDGTVNFTKIRTYTFGVTNKKRNTNGVENLIAALSPTQLAIDINYCHWCGLEGKIPTVYIVNTKTGNESLMGMITNVKASTDGKTFTYQKMKQVPYVCPKPADDPNCSDGMYPDFSYVATGSVLTGKLN
jgi:hypothetical protein